METTRKLTEGCTALRILAPKSLMKFGKYQDLTLDDVLKIDRYYLVWAYYTQSCISYRQDIIEELKIIPIEKPGTSKEVYFDCKRAYYADLREALTEEQYMGAISHERARIRSIGRSRCATANLRNNKSKGFLQAMNHGRK